MQRGSPGQSGHRARALSACGRPILLLPELLPQSDFPQIFVEIRTIQKSREKTGICDTTRAPRTTHRGSTLNQRVEGSIPSGSTSFPCQRGDHVTARPRCTTYRTTLCPVVASAVSRDGGFMKTTRKPKVDLTKVAPELVHLGSKAIRLHPRRAFLKDLGVSNLGGPLLWPAAETWPVCNDAIHIGPNPLLRFFKRVRPISPT